MLMLMGGASKSGVFNLFGDNIISQTLCFALVLALSYGAASTAGDYLANKGADRIKLPDGSLGPALGQAQGGNPPAGAYDQNQAALLNNSGKLNGTFGDAVANRTPAPAPQIAAAPEQRPDMLFPELALIR